MPRAMALRVVSLPAAMSRLKNISSSRSDSGPALPSSPVDRGPAQPWPACRRPRAARLRAIRAEP